MKKILNIKSKIKIFKLLNEKKYRYSINLMIVKLHSILTNEKILIIFNFASTLNIEDEIFWKKSKAK